MLWHVAAVTSWLYGDNLNKSERTIICICLDIYVLFSHVVERERQLIKGSRCFTLNTIVLVVGGNVSCCAVSKKGPN